jgi:hypothetical protein
MKKSIKILSLILLAPILLTIFSNIAKADKTVNMNPEKASYSVTDATGETFIYQLYTANYVYRNLNWSYPGFGQWWGGAYTKYWISPGKGTYTIWVDGEYGKKGKEKGKWKYFKCAAKTEVKLKLDHVKIFPPAKIIQGEPASFSVKCYDWENNEWSSAEISYQWAFPQSAEVSDSTLANPDVTFKEPGDFTITVEVTYTKQTEKKSDQKKIKVEPKLKSVDITDYPPGDVIQGKAVKFTSQAYDIYDNPWDYSKYTLSHKWYAQDKPTDPISTGGSRTLTHEFVYKGTHTINVVVTYTEQPSISDDEPPSINVIPPHLDILPADPEKVVAGGGVNGSATLTARLEDEAGGLITNSEVSSQYPVTFSVDNPAIGSITTTNPVTPSGGIAKATFTSQEKSGIAAITASSPGLAQKPTCQVKVIKPKIVVTPDPVTVIVGKTQQFTAKGYDPDTGEEIPIDPVWSVEGDIGSIGQNGLFTAVDTLPEGESKIQGKVVASVGDAFGKATVTVVKGAKLSYIEAVDANDGSRRSRGTLQMVSVNLAQRREARISAYKEDPKLDWAPDEPAWWGLISDKGVEFVDFKGTSGGKEHAQAGQVTKSAAIEIINGLHHKISFGTGPFKKLQDIFVTVAQKLKGDKDKVSANISGSWEWYKVDQVRSDSAQTTYEFSAGNGISYSQKFYIPSLSVSFPFVKIGVFAEPDLSITITGIEIVRDGTKNPVAFTEVGGGASLGGSISGGAGAEFDVKKVITVKADLKGTVGASGSFDVRAPPAVLTGSYNIGELTVSGRVIVSYRNGKWIDKKVTRVVWSGISGEKTIDLSGYFSGK